MLTFAVLCLSVAPTVAGFTMLIDTYSSEEKLIGAIFMVSGLSAATLSIIALTIGA